MKSKIVKGLGILGFITAMSFGSVQASEEVSVEQMCDRLGEFAYHTMIVRQFPTDKSVSSEIVDSTMKGEAHTVGMRVVDLAYSQPVVEAQFVESLALGFSGYITDECMSENSGIVL
jgi:hypothetical protein